MGAISLYGIYEGDTLVFKGKSCDVADYLSLAQTCIRTYAMRKTITRGKYHIRILGDYIEEPKPKKKTQKQIEREEHLEDIIAKLKTYGQTFVRNPEEWRKEVNEAGIQFRCVPYKNGYTLERS